MLPDIRPDHLKIVQDILQKFVPEREVWAFGSRAKWLAKEYSDLDLCILGKVPLSFRTLGLLEEAFEDSDLPYKVDVVDWATTSEGFRKIIERDKVVLQKVERGGSMGSEWPEITFGDFIALQRGHDLPDQDRRPGNVPILGSFGVTGFHDTVKAKAPGVTIGRSGASFGVAAYTDQDYWPLNTALYVTDFKGNDPKFVFYFLKIFDFSGYNSGSAQPSLNRNNLYGIPIQIPAPQIQKNIAEFVSALDDRITLLRETNATLEAIAQALFKSWFVDFDPVHAKQQGRAPEGMDEATAALFPDGFEESELGLVPRGWPIGTLIDLLVLQRGFDLPAGDRVTGDYPIIAASGPNGTHIISMAKAPGVVTGRSGVLGRVFLELEDHWPLNTTLWVKEFRLATPCYAYELLRLADLASFNAGSAVPTLNRNHVHSLKYLLPSNRCIQTYEVIALNLHKRARANQQQAQTLATLRDTLLPRLISGQLRLPEAEAMLEDAVA